MKKDDAADDDALVALNFGDDRTGSEDVSLPFPRSGLWVDYFSGDTVLIDSETLDGIDFEYSEGKIFLYSASP